MRKPQSTKKTLMVAGMVLSLTIIGVSGCGSKTSTPSTTTPTTQSSTATQSKSSSNQPNQKPAQNPAIKATMDISRLQRDQKNALTSAQKAKIEPILQELINTPNPSQDVLQQKADEINAVFTDQQKTFLATPRTPNENKQHKNDATSSSENKPQGDTGNKHTAGSAPNPQVIYQRVLVSLKK